MKKFCKIVTAILLAIFLVTTFVACRPGRGDGDDDGDGGGSDNNKTKLYVFNYNGGYGSDWLDAAAERFEALYADYQGEDGKVGVDVEIKKQKQIINPSDNLDGMKQSVFFTESTNYYALYNAGKVLDITDVVTEKSKFEDKTILSKFYDEQADYYAIDGKYYAIPHYLTTMGINYNADVFKEGYYILNTGYNATTIEAEYAAGKTTDSANSITFGVPNADNSNLAPGPDGETGTYDDGLPATYAEFYLLCDKLSRGSINAVHWAGAPYKEYLPMLLSALAASSDGKEQFYLNFVPNGQATTLIDSFDANGNPVLKSSTAISTSNVAELAKQAGKYYATDFMMTILNNTSWYEQSMGKLFSSAHSHLTAQRDFIRAGYSDTPKKIAMLIDGCWWEGEASDAFSTMAESLGPQFAKQNRNFAYLPFPHPTASMIGQVDSTLYDMYSAIGFVKSGVDPSVEQLSKDFLMFVNSDESLREYSRITSTVKALKYDLTADDLTHMTAFGQSYYHAKNSGDVILPISSDSYFIANQSRVLWEGMFQGTVTGGGNKQSPIALYPSTSQTVTAQDWYNYMVVYANNNWK